MQKRIIIIDDDAAIRETFCEMIDEFEDYTAVATDDGEYFLDLLRNNGDLPDLVLIDIHMAKIDGIDLIRKIGDMGYCGPVGIVTGAIDTIQILARVTAIGRGIRFIGTLQKPFRVRDLEHFIERVFC